MEDCVVQGARLALVALFAAVCSQTVACGHQSRSPPPVERLATDVHMEIGGARLNLPLIALENFAYVPTSFSFDRQDDQDRRRQAIDALIEASGDVTKPLDLSEVTVVVRTYGWNDADMRQRAMCPLLTRSWSRSVCDDPWAPLQQALPRSSFKLVDLESDAIERFINCEEGTVPREMPKIAGKPIVICRAAVLGGGDDFRQVVMRIAGSLGAVWIVWGHGQNGESAESMAAREGEAILAFVNYGIGPDEDFRRLQLEACRLRRPGSADGPNGSACQM
jgi:hypothetical protein